MNRREAFSSFAAVAAVIAAGSEAAPAVDAKFERLARSFPGGESVWVQAQFDDLRIQDVIRKQKMDGTWSRAYVVRERTFLADGTATLTAMPWSGIHA